VLREPGLPTGPDLGLEAYGIPLRVLVIEASAYTAGLLQDVGSLTGLSVEVARDPRGAVRRLRQEFFDAVVIDLPTPHISAQDLFREIVAINLEQAARTVFLASDLGDTPTRKFLTDVGRPFLTQPADPIELFDLVMRVGLGDQEE
jgi:DNA-binding response OmpR family regulator